MATQIVSSVVPQQKSAVVFPITKQSPQPITQTDMTQKELFEKAGVIALATGQRALKQLLAEDKIDRIGRGIKGDPCRYFRG